MLNSSKCSKRCLLKNADAFDEERLGSLMNEKQRLTMQLEQYANARQKRESAKSRLDQIFTTPRWDAESPDGV